jgi:Ca2+-binding EF-hand superfamily protein
MSRLLPAAFAALFSLAAVSGLAHAQGPRGGQDANGDGVVTAQEFEDAAKARFQRMDANHDGVIDGEELAAIQKRMEERRAERPDAGKGPGGGGAALAAMDADHDGKITEAEALAAAKARFAALDTDKDGVLSQAELPARRGPPN